MVNLLIYNIIRMNIANALSLFLYYNNIFADIQKENWVYKHFLPLFLCRKFNLLPLKHSFYALLTIILSQFLQTKLIFKNKI